MQAPFKKLALATAVSTWVCGSMAQQTTPASTNQTNPSAQQAGPQTVTVTATKRAALLTDVPQSIQAITGDQLRNESVTSLSDVVAIVPGASQTFKAAPGFEVLQIRGVSSGAVGDALVGYYIDEIPFGLPNTQYIPPVNVFDLARVEVLRGPQGTLYGQSSMGGALRLITRKPDLAKLAGEVHAGYSEVRGGHQASRLDFMLNAPMVKDTIGLRITGGTSEEDSFIANTGRIRNENLRVKALFKMNEELSVEATAWGIRSRQADYQYGRPATPYLGILDTTQPRGVDTDVTIGNVTVHYGTPIGELLSSTSYMDHEFSYKFSLPGLSNLQPGFGTWLSDNRVHTKSASQEIRLASRADSSFAWIGGAFLQDAKVSTYQEQGWPALAALNLGPDVHTLGDARLTSKSVGVFGEISKDFFNGKFTPTVGLRYYRDSRDVHSVRDRVTTDAGRTFTSWNPRLNLAYKPAAGQLYYVNVAKGFRSGALQSQQGVAAARALGLFAELLMPEDRLWSQELGAKWDIARAVSVETAMYRMDWKDAQLTNLVVNSLGASTTLISGGMDVRGHGLDFGVNWSTPLAGLSLQLAGNVNRTEFARTPPGTIAREGAQIPGSPKRSAIAAANYRTQLGGLRLTTKLSFNYRAHQGELTTGRDSDSIRDWRARLGIGNDHWEAAIYGINLGDQRGVAAVLSSLVVNPIQPRKLGLELTYRF